MRLEIEAALERNVRVIPVLVGGAKQPSSRQLPKELALLARRQAQPLRANQLAIDTGRLLKVLENTFTERQSPPASQRPLSIGREWSVSSGESRVFAGDSHDHPGVARAGMLAPMASGQSVETLGIADVVMTILEARKTNPRATAAAVSRESCGDVIQVRVSLLESSGRPEDQPGRGDVVAAFTARQLGADLAAAFGQKDVIILQ